MRVGFFFILLSMFQVFFALVCMAQEPTVLEPGQVLVDTISEEAPEVHSSTLDANYTQAPTVGLDFRVKVKESGSYHFDLRSYLFDAYLTLREADGTLLAEDDDGLINMHSRLVFELEANRDYLVTACALHGQRGAFQLALNKGIPSTPSPVERAYADLADARSRAAALEKSYGEEDPRVGSALNDLGVILFGQGHLDDARPVFERALAIREGILGQDHVDVAESLNNLASLLQDQGLYQEATPLMARAQTIFEKVLGPDHVHIGTILNNRASLLQAQGEYEEARSLLERSLSVMEAALGPDHLYTAQVLGNLAGLLSTMGNYDEALPLFRRVQAIQEKAQGLQRSKEAENLNNLATLLQEQGKYEEALSLRKQVVVIMEEALGSKHPSTAVSLNNLAFLLQKQGNLEEAQPLYERALMIMEAVFGLKHPNTAQVLSNLAMVLGLQGDYMEAQRLLDRALAIRVEVLGPGHPDIAQTLNNIGGFLKDQGHAEEARVFYERSLRILEETLGADHPTTAASLNNLAVLLKDQGYYEEALPLYERALTIWEKVSGSDNPNTAKGLNNLAILHYYLGNSDDALPLLERARVIREMALGPEHPDVADSFNNLGILHQNQERYGEAQEFFERALAIRETVQGLSHPDTATSLHNLARLRAIQGHFQEARGFFERTLAIHEAMLGADHPHTATSLNSLASLLRDHGHHEEARSLFLRSLSGILRHLDVELPTMSEAERFKALVVTGDPSLLLESLAGLESASLLDAFSLYLQWKGKATRLQAASLRLARADGRENVRRRTGDLRVLAKQLSGLVLLPIAEQEEGHGERIADLRQERLRQERELNRELGLDSILATPSVGTLQAAIPADAVLVDFFVGREVFAWVLGPSGPPQLLSLGDIDIPRRAQEAFLRSTALRGGRTVAAAGPDPAVEILNQVWEPLREAVGAAATVIVSPDGFLCELPLGTLRQADGSFLLEKHRFVYLSDPTRLVENQASTSDREGSILAVGDIDFLHRGEAPIDSTIVTPIRSRIGDSWPPLEATREEINALSYLHQHELAWDSEFHRYDGMEATEERIQLELPNHRYIHLATHGYFEPDHLPSLLTDSEEKQANMGFGEQVEAVGLLPGLLSGLVFAGVNAEADSNRDDGYLSAEEIMHLDLSACDLAVLSACETALGSKRAGEGLMSLRRAFEVAGTKTVVSSMWKVDDRATAQLMKWFYQNYWALRMSKVEALHQAKLRMLRQNRVDFQGDARPETWGAFVLSGDWR